MTVHNNDVLSHNGTDDPGIYRAVYLALQGLIVIGGEDNIFRGCLLFIVECRTALHIDLIMDVKIELADGVRDRNRAAALGFHKVRHVVFGGRDIFLQMVGGDLRFFANGNCAVFRNVNQAAQPVAGNDAAEMILHGEGLRVRHALIIRIVVGSSGNGIARTDMGAVGGDFRAACHIGVGIGSDIVVHAGAADACNTAMAFRSRQARLVLLGGNKPYVACHVPLAAKSAGNVVNRVVPHMGAHIAYQAAAACVGKGLARVLAVASHLQAGQLVRIGSTREGSIQGLLAVDVCAGIAYSHSACGDAIDIGLAVHIGFII